MMQEFSFLGELGYPFNNTNLQVTVGDTHQETWTAWMSYWSMESESLWEHLDSLYLQTHKFP